MEKDSIFGFLLIPYMAHLSILYMAHLSNLWWDWGIVSFSCGSLKLIFKNSRLLHLKDKEGNTPFKIMV